MCPLKVIIQLAGRYHHKLWKVKLCHLQTIWLITVNPLEDRRISKMDPSGTPTYMDNQPGGLTFDCDT